MVRSKILSCLLPVIVAVMCSVAGCARTTSGPVKLLPYPQELSASGQSRKIGPLQVELSTNRKTLRVARESVLAYVTAATRGGSVDVPSVLRIGSIDDPNAQSWLSPADRDFLGVHDRSPEAYVLHIPPAGPLTIVGKSDRGALYGSQTLNQLLLNDAERCSVPVCMIRDWPDMKWRCLSPTLTWYSGYNRLEGYDLCNWTLDEWKWLADWSLLHKCNAWAVCMYGYWPFTLPGHESNVLDVDSFFFNPLTGKKEPWRFTHPNIKKEFLPELIRYANDRGIDVYAYIGKNSFNGTYGLKRPEMNAGGAAELLPFAPGVENYWDACIARILDIGFNGFVFEDPEAYHVPNQNEQCYKTFWEPWAKTYGYTSVKQTDQNKPPLGVHIEYYTWLFRQFDGMIRKHGERLGKHPDIYLISHILLARIMTESTSDEERARWMAMFDEKQGRKVPLIINESNEAQYTKLFGGDRVASLGGRGGSCTCAMRRIASVNNDWLGGPMGASVDYERDCQRHILEAGGFGAMGYIFEWTNTEVFGYIAAQHLWRIAGVPFINNQDQFGFLDYAYQRHYGEQVGHLVARVMDEGTCVNDAMILEGVYGSQYPTTGKALHRDFQFLAAQADRAVELADRAYRLYTGRDPDLMHPSYVPDQFRWNGFDPAADKVFKTERLRLLCVSQQRSRHMCEAALAHRKAERLMAEGATTSAVLEQIDRAVKAARANQLLYQVNYVDDYDATDGLCAKVTEALEALRTRLVAATTAPALQVPEPVRRWPIAPLFIPWEKLTDLTPEQSTYKKPGLCLTTDIGLDSKPDYFRLGVAFTIEAKQANGEWQVIFRRSLGRRSTGWEHWDVPLDELVKDENIEFRLITDSYSRAQERNDPTWKWALWGRPHIVQIAQDGSRRTLYDCVEHLDQAHRFVCMDSDGRNRPFNAGTKDSTGATFEKTSTGPIAQLKSNEGRTTQWVSGFSRWIGTPPHAGIYRCYLGAVDSGWTYAKEGGEVSWISGVVPRKADTAVVFIGGTDYTPGEAEFYCDDRRLLDFKTGSTADANWKHDDIALRYIHGGDTRDERTTHGLSGVFILNLPGRYVSAGKPLKLAVRMKAIGGGWVMAHAYTDPFQATQQSAPPEPVTGAIAAFTPHIGGNQGVTIGEFNVRLSRK